MKILFINLPYHGHVVPTIGLVQELIKKGCEVTYLLPFDWEEKIAESGATFRGYKNHKQLAEQMKYAYAAAEEIITDFDLVMYEQFFFLGKHLAEKYCVIESLENRSISPGEIEQFEVTYSIPQNAKDGKYYLALIADPYNEIGDDNQSDNFSFVTVNNMEPLYLTSGCLSYIPENIVEVRNLVCDKFKNAYRNNEIKTSLIRMKKQQ